MPTEPPGQAAVFLDRDGTINEEVGYIRDLEHLRLIPGAAAAISLLNGQHIPVIVISNQSGAARGYYPVSWIEHLHEHLVAMLAAEGAQVDAIYYCPHLPEGIVPQLAHTCECRKPQPGLLIQAAREHHLSLAGSTMIGDKAVDVDAARRAGCQAVLLRTGYGERVLAGTYQYAVEPDYIARDIADAVDWVLARPRRAPAPD